MASRPPPGLAHGLWGQLGRPSERPASCMSPGPLLASDSSLAAIAGRARKHRQAQLHAGAIGPIHRPEPSGPTTTSWHLTLQQAAIRPACHSRPTAGARSPAGWAVPPLPGATQNRLDPGQRRRAPGEGNFSRPPRPHQDQEGWQRFAGPGVIGQSERWGRLSLGCGPLDRPTCRSFFTSAAARGPIGHPGWLGCSWFRPCCLGALCAWQRSSRSPYQWKPYCHWKPLQPGSNAMDGRGVLAARPWLALNYQALLSRACSESARLRITPSGVRQMRGCGYWSCGRPPKPFDAG